MKIKRSVVCELQQAQQLGLRKHYLAQYAVLRYGVALSAMYRYFPKVRSYDVCSTDLCADFQTMNSLQVAEKWNVPLSYVNKIVCKCPRI